MVGQIPMALVNCGNYRETFFSRVLISTLGSLAIVNQTLKWAPNPTTDAEAGFWYTELRQGYWGKSCLNLQSFGSTVAVALKISKDKFRPAILDVGVNVGCGPTAEYRRIGSAELHAGIDRPSTFEFQLSSFLSREELGNLNAIVLTHVESTEEGTSFFVDDVEIGCDLGRGPKERL
ncbi:hypothetical protein HK098_005653 [Nowakowskiella sp. JEL0407]|nr:hypothetical protein HK098_005653 [Nowakowskiella sp. JEL0407]